MSRDNFAGLQEIYPVSRETFAKFELLVDGLFQWQRKTNLVSPSTLEGIWTRHIADSLQCVSLKPMSRKWVDIGSGGGFPGLVIAAVMSENGKASVDLVESNHKKAAFLRQMSRQMKVPVSVHAERIESVTKQIGIPEIVTARALAGLPKLLELAEPWLAGGATGLFHKGRDYQSELAKCDGLWTFDLVHHASKVAHESAILEISNLQRVN